MTCLSGGMTAFFVLTMLLGVRTDASNTMAAEVVRTFVRALDDADLDLLMSTIDANASFFLPTQRSPRRVEGRAHIRAALAPALVRHGTSQVSFERPQPAMQVQEFGNIAVVTLESESIRASTVDFSHATFVLRRRAGGWWIIHSHGSVADEPQMVEATALARSN